MKEKAKLILSIDGGGIRGIISLVLLNYIEKQLQSVLDYSLDFTEKIDLFAGTSAGAIISAALIIEEDHKKLFSLQDILSLYKERGAQLFNLHQPGNAPSEGLRLLLKRWFGSIILGDLSKDFVFVSHDQNTDKPFLFTNNNPALSSVSLDIALAACSAVPEYFQPITFGKHQLVDGVVAAKNPAEIALTIAQEKYPDCPLILLSFGTGDLSGEFYDAIEKEVDAVDQRLTMRAESDDKLHYFRFQPKIVSADPRMDNATPDNIHALINDAEQFMVENSTLFTGFINCWKAYLS